MGWISEAFGPPPLLRLMNERRIGDLIVRRDTIMEPMTSMIVARNFPSEEAASAAAHEMNDVADWPGVIKTIAEKRQPNCVDELERIAEAHGGKLARGATDKTTERCADVARKLESKSGSR